MSHTNQDAFSLNFIQWDTHLPKESLRIMALAGTRVCDLEIESLRMRVGPMSCWCDLAGPSEFRRLTSAACCACCSSESLRTASAGMEPRRSWCTEQRRGSITSTLIGGWYSGVERVALRNMSSSRFITSCLYDGRRRCCCCWCWCWLAIATQQQTIH